MGWIIAILALSLVMAVMTIAELRQSVRAGTVQLPELIIADRAIAVFVLATFTVAIVGLILIAANALP